MFGLPGVAGEAPGLLQESGRVGFAGGTSKCKLLRKADSNQEAGRSRFLFVCNQSASNYGADSTTWLLTTAPVSVDVALAVLLIEPSLASCALIA